MCGVATSRSRRRGRPLSGTDVRCGGRSRRSTDVGHRGDRCVNAVPSGTSILVVCPPGSPRWASCVYEETLVSVACRPIFVFQARGLIAVGQRLAPMSKARTNFEERETLVNFFPGGDVFWCNTSCGHWGDPSGHCRMHDQQPKFGRHCAMFVGVRAFVTAQRTEVERRDACIATFNTDELETSCCQFRTPVLIHQWTFAQSRPWGQARTSSYMSVSLR